MNMKNIKNMKKPVNLIAAGLLTLTATQANAAVLDIVYRYTEVSDFFASIPMFNGILTDPGVVPSNGLPPFTPVPTPVWGTGTIDTVSGDISLDPMNYELVIASGSVGFLSWASTLHGSFAGNTYTMTSASTSGGVLICADDFSSGCLGSDQPHAALLLDDDSTIVFSSLTTGGLGSYVEVDEVFTGVFATTTIEMEIGGAIPLPGAAWLFGSGLVGLLGLARQHRSK